MPEGIISVTLNKNCNYCGNPITTSCITKDDAERLENTLEEDLCDFYLCDKCVIDALLLIGDSKSICHLQ